GVAILDGAKVTAIDLGQDGARIQSTRGEIRARAVVGADGVGSFVRRALGAPRGRWQAQVVEVDTPEARLDRPRDLLHFDLTDRSLSGYAWDFPTLTAGCELVCRGVYELRRDSAHGAPDVTTRLLARLTALGLSSRGLRIKRFAERGIALHEP